MLGSWLAVARTLTLTSAQSVAPAPSIEDAACVGCHPIVAAEWERSSHRTAYSGAEFQAAFALEPRSFCSDCHAPSSANAPVSAIALEIGVGCVSCHGGAGDGVLAGSNPGPDELAPHPVVRKPTFATAEACARCHEFAFPDTTLRESSELMQSTVQEHAASQYADRSCADCHMPQTSGHRDHRFSASTDPTVLRRALRVTAHRIDSRTVRISLRAAEVGHAVPTGDLFRRLEVKAEVEGRPEASATRYLARHFGPVRQRNGTILRGETRDDRVPADGSPRVVELSVDAHPSETIRWSVAHQRVAHQPTFDDRDARLDGQTLLLQGRLAAPPPPPVRPRK